MSTDEPEAAAKPADEAGDVATPRSVIDKDGDLVLRVGEERSCSTTEFLVCSSTLRRASPVWKAMFFGGFREYKPAEGGWVVALPDDDPCGLNILLKMAHAIFSQTPRQIDLARIHELVILMDKYDTLRFMRPWKDDWLAKVKSTSGTRNGPDLSMAAYIALQMGTESTAFEIVSFISKHATVDSQNNLRVFSTFLLDSLDTAVLHSILKWYGI